jgi:hypothetical protein
MKNTIPEHLQSTYRLLSLAFPKGIDNAQYLPVLFILYEHMCDGNLAEVIALFTGKDYGIVLNDVHRVGSVSYNPSSMEIKNVRDLLLRHGFEKWINED